MAKVKAGEGPCPVCKERIVWRENDSGTISCFCQDCDFQGYAKDGTEAKRRILAAYGVKGPQEPEPGDGDSAPPKKDGGIFGGLFA